MSRILKEEWEKKEIWNKHLPEGMTVWTVPREDYKGYYDKIVSTEITKELWEELDKKHKADVDSFNERYKGRYHVEDNDLWSSTLERAGVDMYMAAYLGNAFKKGKFTVKEV